MTLQTHKALKVWQQSKDLVSKVYKMTATFPREEAYFYPVKYLIINGKDL